MADVAGVLEVRVEQAGASSGQTGQALSSSLCRSYSAVWIAGTQSAGIFAQSHSVLAPNIEGRWPRPAAGQPKGRDYEQEKAAFFALVPELMSKYLGQYVAVHGGVVVDHDSSSSRLVRRFFARHGRVPVFIGYVGGRRAVRGRTPRLGRPYK